ncbi:MAG: hypothetical protein Q7S33_05035 [Nanoarchaeota archaeon]|nr:hypothetical protein [Nanoarchaeota archaeon]
MGNFRSDNRGGGGFRNSSGHPGSSGSRGGFGGRDSRGFRDRDSGSFERKRLEMHEVTCDRCKKQCEVPFKPTGDKPVFCRDCFGKEGDSGSNSRSNFDSRNKNTNVPVAGISQEQFKQINAKLDKIIEFLESIEFEDELEEDEEDKEN